MSKYLPPSQNVLKYPGGNASSGKGLTYPGRLKLPAAAASQSVTHPGYTVVVDPDVGRWDRWLLDLDSYGTAIKTGLSLRAKPVVVQFLDLIIWCNGVDPVYVYDPSSGNVYSLGITNPTSAPGLADTGTGSFTGTYTYAIQWYRSDTGETSALSSLATHTASGSGSAIQVTWTDPSITGVDKCRIFRSKTGGVGLYRIAEVAIATGSYDDSTADSSIDITLVAPTRPAPGGSSSVPVFDYIGVYAQRLWGIVGNTLYWSEPSSPWLVPATNSMELPNERDVGTGFAKAGGVFYISQKRHLYYVADLDLMEGIGGRPVLVPVVTQADDSTGFASQHAVVNVENGIEFMSGEGKPYRLPSQRGLIAAEIGPQLEGTLQKMLRDKLGDVEGVYAEKLRKVFFTVPLDSAGWMNRTLVHDLTNDSWSLGPPMECVANYRETDGSERMVFGNVRGDVCQVGVGHGYGAYKGTLSGSVSSATKNTITDSSAAFDAGVVGLPITLFDDKWNRLQDNIIASRVSGTQVKTVFAWTSFPSSTDQTFYYTIGACLPEWSFGWFDHQGWAPVREILVKYVPGAGKLGLFLALDDNPEELVGVVNMAGTGVERIYPMRGGKRSRLTLRFFDGAEEMKLIGLEIEIGAPGGSW